MARLLLVPNCKLCRVPFVGLRGRLYRLLWHVEPFRKNPNIYNSKGFRQRVFPLVEG